MLWLWRSLRCSFSSHQWASEIPAPYECHTIACCRCGLTKTIHAAVPASERDPQTGCRHRHEGAPLAGTVTIQGPHQWGY